MSLYNISKLQRRYEIMVTKNNERKIKLMFQYM